MFELIFMMIMASTFLFMGWRIWKKEQITLIHSYHYKKVAESDKRAYTEQMGKGVIIMGIGMLLTGVIDYLTHTPYGWIGFVVCFIWGFAIIISAQKKYNGGMF